MKKIVLVLLSTDRFSFPLLRYLVLEGRRYGWKTCVGSMFESSVLDKIREEKFSNDITFINITDFRQCDHAIRKADLVVAMMPDMMLLQVADSCIEHKKDLISPARLSRKMRMKKEKAEENNILFLIECGFSPGLDHITAKKVIDNIHLKGGIISSFTTYSGSIIDEKSVDNQWKFKLTEPANEIINFGKQNNRYITNGKLQHVPYHQLFDRSQPIKIHGLNDMVAVPEGDSLNYRRMYQLFDAKTVIKGKLFKKEFDHIWKLIVKLGLTDSVTKIDLLEDKSFYNFLESLLPYSPYQSLEYKLKHYLDATEIDIEKLKFLGLLDEDWLDNDKDINAASILLYLLENKFSLNTDDIDCIAVQHTLEYTLKDSHYNLVATLVTQGENQMDSATAKAVGLTTGAAAKAVMLGNISIKGIHIPIKKEIYEPILDELDDLGVTFHIEEEKVKYMGLNSIFNGTILNEQ